MAHLLNQQQLAVALPGSKDGLGTGGRSVRQFLWLALALALFAAPRPAAAADVLDVEVRGTFGPNTIDYLGALTGVAGADMGGKAFTVDIAADTVANDFGAADGFRTLPSSVLITVDGHTVDATADSLGVTYLVRWNFYYGNSLQITGAVGFFDFRVSTSFDSQSPFPFGRMPPAFIEVTDPRSHYPNYLDIDPNPPNFTYLRVSQSVFGTVTPEPEEWWLMATGFLTLGSALRRQPHRRLSTGVGFWTLQSR